MAAAALELVQKPSKHTRDEFRKAPTFSRSSFKKDVRTFEYRAMLLITIKNKTQERLLLLLS